MENEPKDFTDDFIFAVKQRIANHKNVNSCVGLEIAKTLIKKELKNVKIKEITLLKSNVRKVYIVSGDVGLNLLQKFEEIYDEKIEEIVFQIIDYKNGIPEYCALYKTKENKREIFLLGSCIEFFNKLCRSSKKN